MGQAPGCNRYVITPDTQYPGAEQTTEILILYAHQVDAEYYQGLYTDENGLTYYTKYAYENVSQTGLAKDKAVGYVITADARDLFVTDDYEIVPFGDYCAVVPVAAWE